MKTVDVLWLPLVVVSLWAASAMANEKLSDATSRFTLDLLKSVFPKVQGNLIMSPVSVSTLLAMVHQGAFNQSATQLEKVLHLTQEESKTGFKEVLENFQKRKYKSKLEVANRIFVNPDFDIIPAFNSILHTNFDTAAEKIDFKQPEVAAERINKWVRFHSKDRISELIRPEAISGRTQMVLTNVIYFKGVWTKTFKEANTVTGDFHTSANGKVQAPIMAMSDLFRCSEDKELGAKWLELPFDGYDFSMVLVLPTVDHGLSDVVSRMTIQHMNNMINSRATKKVSIKLPRFKLNAEVQLVPSLQQLGLVEIFDQRSNLEGISTSKGPLVVSDILHKAEIEVNEEGTEASAASGIVVNTLSLVPDYEEVDFFATQPFLSIIVDKVNNMPIFVARVADPSKS